MANVRSRRTLPSALRRVLYAIGAACLVAGFMTAAAIPASAATCSGYGCDGQNPYGAGCFNGSEVVYDLALTNSIGQSAGRVRLWYSPSCRTVWATIYNAPSPDGAGEGWADIHRNSDNDRFDCSIPQGASSCYTAMLYDGGTTSHAHAEYTPGTIYGTASATTPNF
jgi:hypothetical protein